MNVYVLSSKNNHGDYTIDGVFSSYEAAEIAAFKCALYETTLLENDECVTRRCQISNGEFMCFYKQYLNYSWTSNVVFGMTYKIDKYTIDAEKSWWNRPVDSSGKLI